MTAQPYLPWSHGKSSREQEAIIRAANAHGISPRMVLSKSHEPDIVAARRDVIVELRKARYSCCKIGKVLGGLHHTTILHHLRKVEPLTPQRSFDFEIPDTSGEWAI